MKRSLFIDGRNPSLADEVDYAGFVDEKPSKEPVVDQVTMRLLHAMRNPLARGLAYRSTETCPCGAHADLQALKLSDNLQVGSTLPLHVLAWHRDDVSIGDIKLISALPLRENDLPPTAEELITPPPPRDW